MRSGEFQSPCLLQESCFFSLPLPSLSLSLTFPLLSSETGSHSLHIFGWPGTRHLDQAGVLPLEESVCLNAGIKGGHPHARINYLSDSATRLILFL